MKTNEQTQSATAKPLAPATSSATVDDLSKLLCSCDELMNIVEGCRGERWAAKGKRLVDTPEWCEFYVRWSKIAMAAKSPNAELSDGLGGHSLK